MRSPPQPTTAACGQPARTDERRCDLVRQHRAVLEVERDNPTISLAGDKAHGILIRTHLAVVEDHAVDGTIEGMCVLVAFFTRDQAEREDQR